MTVEERIKLIVEKIFPMPEKPCPVTKGEITSLRKIKTRSLTDKLHGLSDEEKESLIAEWES